MRAQMKMCLVNARRTCVSDEQVRWFAVEVLDARSPVDDEEQITTVLTLEPGQKELTFNVIPQSRVCALRGCVVGAHTPPLDTYLATEEFFRNAGRYTVTEAVFSRTETKGA